MNLPLAKDNIDYQFLFENSSDGILIHDLNSDLVVSANKNCLELLDRTEEEILCKSPINLRPASENVAEEFHKYIEKIKENKKGTIEREHVRKDGTKIYLKINSYIMPAPQENLLVVIYRDITAFRQQQLQINQQNKALSQKNKELEAYVKSNSNLENFAFTAAHDLQSPINTMVSFSKMLLESLQEKDFEEAMEFTEFIGDAAVNLKALIKDLLDFSRAKSVQYHPETFNLNLLVARLTKELDFSIKKQKATINIDELPNLFVGDRVKIRQLFQNLLTNGIKFKTPDKDPVVDVLFSEDATNWKFQVKDNGIGIAKKDFEEIFKLFRRLNHKKKFSGTGIGLSLCQNIVEQHKGKIWIESEVGLGTSFFFTIPKPD